MLDNKPVTIISDAPQLKSDSVMFGFEGYARTIADLIANKANETPLVIGIYGPWGSGKTTLMATVRDLLTNIDYEDRETYRKCKTVWFQAWKYDKENEILAGLIEEIFKTIKKDKSSAPRIKRELEEIINRLHIPKGIGKLVEKIIGKVAPYSPRMKGGLEEAINRVDIVKGLGKVAEKFIGLDPTDFILEPAYKAKLGFYDTFQEFFDRLLWTYAGLRPNFSSSEEPDDQKGALVIFIDDLDRCPKRMIVKVLEIIKLFIDKKGCVSVIGAANEIIEDALKDTYSDENAKKFMDKIVQVTFNLPQIDEDDFERYIDGMDAIDPDSRENIRPHLPQILATTTKNPRRFKRFLNDLYLMKGIHKNKSTGVDYKTLLFWKIVEFEAPELVREANKNPAILNMLKDNVENIVEEDKATGRWEIAPDKIKAVRWKSLHPYLQNRRLKGLIRNMDVTPEQITQLTSVGSPVMSAEAGADTEKRIRQHEFESTAQRCFDEMAEVPEGTFQYGDDKKTKTIDVCYYVASCLNPLKNMELLECSRESEYRYNIQ